jgi:hypothetical protein
MKTSTALKCCVAVLGMTALVASGQGTFQNLDFESINPDVILSSPPNFVPFADALPGWIGYYGTNLATQAIINGVSLGGVLITVITPFPTSIFNFTDAVIGGIATATLDGGIKPGAGGQWPAAIAQTGLIPPGTSSLRFSVGSHSDVNYLSVSLNGQNMPIIPLQSGPNFEIYGADISAFAGSTAELRFTEQPPLSPSHSPPTIAYLDDIQFSDQSIPEPSELSLFALTALFFGWRFVRKRH